jgi:hypothetical protein
MTPYEGKAEILRLEVIGKGTSIERHCCFGSITCSSTTPWLKICHRVVYQMHNGLKSSHSCSPTTQGQESRLTLSSNSNQNIFSTCKQNSNTNVDQTESTNLIPKYSHISNRGDVNQILSEKLRKETEDRITFITM